MPMRFGDYECFTLIMDSFLLDGGAMFGVVPKPLWEEKIAADGDNRIPMQARSLLIQGNGRTILVDTGVGDKLPEKFQRIYGIHPAKATMSDRLAPYGLTVADITDVLLTHLHFDHAGGSTCIQNGKIVPTFPNARYYVQQDQWDLACCPSVRDTSSYIPDNFMPLQEQGVLQRIHGAVTDWMDGIDLIPSNGHTQGQQHPLVKGKGKGLFFCADLIPTSAHLPLAWHMAYDNQPLLVLEEKKKLLSRAMDENWILCFEHDPKIAAASVRDEKGRAILDHSLDL